MLEMNVLEVTLDNSCIGPECFFYYWKHEKKLSRNVALQEGVTYLNL